MLKAFRVNLKACLGLVLPITNTASSSSGKNEAGFWVILFRGPRLLLCGPYYTVTIVLYDYHDNNALTHNYSLLPRKLNYSWYGNEYKFIMGCTTSGVLWEASKCIEAYGTKIFTLHGSPNQTVYSYY